MPIQMQFRLRFQQFEMALGYTHVRAMQSGWNPDWHDGSRVSRVFTDRIGGLNTPDCRFVLESIHEENSPFAAALCTDITVTSLLKRTKNCGKIVSEVKRYCA